MKGLLMGKSKTTGMLLGSNKSVIRREYVANFPVGVIAVRLTASEAGKLGVKVSLSRDRGIVNHSASTNPNTIVLDVGGSDAGSIAFSSAVRIQSDGGEYESPWQTSKGGTDIERCCDFERWEVP